MTRRAALVGSLMLLTCIGCGRSSKSPEAAEVAGAGGTPSNDETSSQGGDPGHASCEGSEPYCLLACRSFDDATPAECVDAAFVCPKGSTTYDSCPADACIRRTQSCCAATGNVAVPDCNDDGTIGECPEGYAKATTTCLPQGVPIEDCLDLQKGEACTDPELVCYTSKCGRNCYCKADDAGNLSWDCFALPC